MVNTFSQWQPVKPAPVVTDEIHQRVMDEVIYPTVRGMAAEGNPYTGFLYAGLMIMSDGTPKVIEYNCRFGDPETQPIMLRLQSDLVELCQAAIDGKLNHCQSQWDRHYHKGDVICGLPQQEIAGEKVFHAGTCELDGQVVTNGGRVLCATAMGDTVQQAQQRAYQLAQQIDWDGMFYREDIGYRAINREQA